MRIGVNGGEHIRVSFAVRIALCLLLHLLIIEMEVRWTRMCLTPSISNYTITYNSRLLDKQGKIREKKHNIRW
jgi:hypothetical protein